MKYSIGMEAGWHHLYAIPLFCSSLLISPGKELTPTSGSPIFVAATHGTSLDCLPLMGSRAYTYKSHRNVTSGENVLNWLPPPGQSKEATD